MAGKNEYEDMSALPEGTPEERANRFLWKKDDLKIVRDVRPSKSAKDQDKRL